jgi:serine/threonine-protein kinase
VTAIVKGTVLADRYRLVEKLGEGSMGSVWRAEHLTLGSEVAIKLLDASIARHNVALARFMREARSAASLKSIHVVQIHDFGVFGEIPFIAMELLRGETLGARVRRLGKLEPAETARILTHVARAVGKAHEAGVVHRDLKPDNIFLVREDDEEFAKVLDFGVAKAGEGVFAATLTSAGKLLGTPAYMSAEQAAGNPVDRRTDLWAMAVIAFECLTGTLPFIGDDLPDLLHAIHDGPIPIPSRLGRVPVGFDAWFARGVARRLDDRFRSAARWRPSSGGSARTTPPARRAAAPAPPRAWARRTRRRTSPPAHGSPGAWAPRPRRRRRSPPAARSTTSSGIATSWPTVGRARPMTS